MSNEKTPSSFNEQTTQSSQTEQETGQNRATGPKEAERGLETPSAPFPSPSFGTAVDRQIGLERQGALRAETRAAQPDVTSENIDQPTEASTAIKDFDAYEVSQWDDFYASSQREENLMNRAVEDLLAHEDRRVQENITQLETSVKDRSTLGALWANMSGQSQTENEHLNNLRKQADEITFEKERYARNLQSDLSNREAKLRAKLQAQRQAFEQGKPEKATTIEQEGQDQGMGQ